MKLNLIIALAPILLIIITEILLRLTLGLGNPLLYIKDEQIGYLIAPNQKTYRNGKLIEINQYSMRSQNIKAKRNSDDLRVFLLGDSIANGGWWTDQNETISALLGKYLTAEKLNFQQVEVLNASANSWGPRNQLAYLERYSCFDSQILVLLLNTDDFYALKPSSLVVGKDPDYPNKKPLLALQELKEKLFPAPPHPDLKNHPKEKGDLVQFNLDAVNQIYQLTQENNCQFILAITPLKKEVIPDYKPDYRVKGRQRFIDWATKNNVTVIDFIPIFKAEEDPENLYFDSIHLNEKGTELVSKNIFKAVKEKINSIVHIP